jgi:hypothetical protein
MMLFGRLVAAAAGLAIAATHASACKCGGIHGRTAWETAEKEAQGSTAIFEGTPVRFEVQWDILSAKPGDPVSADSPASEAWTDRYPRMRITFKVKKVYKGDAGTEVQVRTGMGGGDCGAQFATGLDYLVYAYGPSPAELAVSLCSPGGWLGSNYLATELRHLGKQRPLADDLAPLDYWTPMAVARWDREREEFIRRYATATGQICGRLSPENEIDGEWRRVAFLSAAGYSPHGSSPAEVDRHGKFCSDRLGPGGYYLYFTGGPWNGELKSAMYYPGVVDRVKATVLKVGAGQVQSNLVFHVPKQEEYTVRGFVSTDDKWAIGENGASVALVSLDGQVWRGQAVDFRGSFPLPKVKYFAFENVLPGRYMACAFASGRGWLTRKVEVNVTTHAKLIFLELKHNRTSGK